ncbi:MAG: site-specific integrase [Clostridia bacterium]|nr:site-specific integrase [Clostridia bacterium]
MSRRKDGIYHRKDGYWEARYVKEIDVQGKRKYGSVYARSYQEAKTKRQAKVEQIILYQKPVTSMQSLTVSQLVEEWLFLNKSRIKPSTYQRYYGFYKNHIQNELNRQVVLYCTTATLHAFALGRLQTGLSPQSVNAVLVFLHSCFKYGHKQYSLPLPDIVYLASEKREIQVLSQEEQRKFVQYLQQDIDVYKFGVLLALYTGLRVGELCALHWEDITEDCIYVRRTMQRLACEKGKGTVLFEGTPKTKASVRNIPIPSFLMDHMSYFRKKGCNQEYFLGCENKRWAEPRVMQYKFKRYLKGAGLKDFRFHSLRHTFATRCIECGCSIKATSCVLGHQKIGTTLDLYTHISMENKRQNLELLQRVW